MHLLLRLNQFTLCRSFHAFDDPLSPQRGRLITSRFLIDQFYGSTASRIFGSRSLIVFFHPRLDVFRDTGVKTPIYALDNVNVPHN